MQNIKQIIEGYQIDLETYEKADTTINNYITFINKFVRDNNINTDNDLECLNSYMFYTNYMRKLKQDGNCNNTINNRLKILNTFCNYLKRCKLIKENMVSDIPKLPEETKQVTMLDDEQIQLVINAMQKRVFADYKRNIDAVNAFREYLMVCFMISMGIRVKECCDIRECDINIKNMTVGIRGKGYKGEVSRVLNIPKNLLPIMEKWEELRSDIDIKVESGEYYFVSALTKKHVKPLSIEKRLHQLEDELGIENLHPHLLRHSFASNNLHQERLTLHEVADILGHTNPNVTSKFYVAVNKQALKKTSTASLHYAF